MKSLKAERYRQIAARLGTANANLTDRLKEPEAPTTEPVSPAIKLS